MIKQKTITEVKALQTCAKSMLCIKDAIDVLEGRWRLPIMLCLTFGKKRFTQIGKETDGITDKMLSKELKYLEANKLIAREVFDTFPPTVEYSITAHGKSLEKVLIELKAWGMQHRKKMVGK